MSETKTFPTADVMSVVTGRLMADIGGVYKLLEWMSGEPIWTHQLPRVGREAIPVILAMHPGMQEAIDEAEQVTTKNYQTWLETWMDRYGSEIAVPKFSAHDHESIDPVSELAEHVHPDRIITLGSKKVAQ